MSGREPNPASAPPPKEKKRALPTEFDRQVQQIRNDINTVRANLAAAERALQGVPPIPESSMTSPAPPPATIQPPTATPPQQHGIPKPSDKTAETDTDTDTATTTAPIPGKGEDMKKDNKGGGRDATTKVKSEPS